MSNQLSITNDKQVRFLNHAHTKTIFNVTNQAMTSFAIDDAIAEAIGKNLSPPTIRTWVHEPTIVLGIPDSRLPYISDGLQFIESSQTKAIIRNSGGLAVFLDPGVLNMSIIIPSQGNVAIHDGYEMMYRFIRQLFQPYTNNIEAYEIKGSYCPGDYDLSIQGIKFAGISQRRVRGGVAVQIYLDIEGNSQSRAQTVKEFYRLSKRNETTNYHYPDIRPSTMGTISSLLDKPFTVESVLIDIEKLLTSDYQIVSESLTAEEEIPFFKRLKQMKKRNERLS